MASFIRIGLSVAGGAGIPGASEFARQLERVVRQIEADIQRELRRRMAAARRELRPVIRRIYQQELRRNAPVDTGELRRSIRVNVRNRGSDIMVAEVRMRFYGVIINGARWSRYYGWADVARDIAERRIRQEAARILQRAFRETS